MMLKTHLDNKERELLTQFKTSSNSGHAIHKGTRREAFLRQFLAEHLSERFGVETGEIISVESQSGDKRNQVDIIIYNKDYPKLDFGGKGGINTFLSESVLATIEVKSKLTKGELKKAILSARTIKAIKRDLIRPIPAVYTPPAILNYVIAYDGPSFMPNVYEWIDQIYKSENIVYPELSLDMSQRIRVPSPAIDGVFILGKGMVLFDNLPSWLVPEPTQEYPDTKWLILNLPFGSLFTLFLYLTMTCSSIAKNTYWEPGEYFAAGLRTAVTTQNLFFGD